eukprot:TRINITY_DN9787_c0_g1_i1.p1 TRINITY_DN9787_c0_g1~~TRINITY_DN9787_c0_g1_i1.p1  ORF type:complete len:340 (-),score=64.89 TRINITY_DN9787_c0_g1_i1:10-1029(-)
MKSTIFFLFTIIVMANCQTYVPINIAYVQTYGHPNHTDLAEHKEIDATYNLEYLEIMAKKAAAEGADIIIFPELYLQGYNLKTLTAQVAQPKNGSHFEFSSRVARENSIGILYGYVERDGSTIYNSAIFVDDTGAEIINYRKTHLFGDYERSQFTAGDEIGPVFQFKGHNFGVLICYDIEFPEPARELALLGAQVLLIPTANFDPFEFVNRRIIEVRAAENGVYVFYVNRHQNDLGIHFNGESVVVDPYGAVLEHFPREYEGMGITPVNMRNFTSSTGNGDWGYMLDRRPDLYTQIQSPCPTTNNTADDSTDGRTDGNVPDSSIFICFSIPLMIFASMS